MKISAVIIAKNAEYLIADCIESLDFCNEVIVVDNGSTDLTVEVAKKLGAKVIKNPKEDFATQRNIGLQFAKGEWVLYVDTDERVTDELKRNIQFKMSNVKFQNTKAYKIQRKNYYLGTNPWPKIEYIERLFKRSALKGWHGKIHESPIIEGHVGTLDGFLLHFTHRDLSSMLNKTIVWSQIEANLRIKSHHPKIVAWRFFRVMLTGFLEYFITQKGYKVGMVGLIESVYQAFSMFITYARVWETQNTH